MGEKTNHYSSHGQADAPTDAPNNVSAGHRVDGHQPAVPSDSTSSASHPNGNSHADSTKPEEIAGRFVLLVPRHVPTPDRLIAGLRQRSALLRMTADAASALVEIAHFRAQVLIVHEPDTQPDLEPLLAAVRCYHPGVICWRHEAAREGRRENLSAFACEISARPTSPRFEPEPVANQQDQPLPFTAPQTSNDHHNELKSDETLRESSLKSSNGHTHTSDDVDHKSTAGGPNDHRRQRQGLALVRDDGQPPGEAKPAATPQRDSLGQRLSIHLGTNDDLTAAPLLSAEEIELLRGPVEES